MGDRVTLRYRLPAGAVDRGRTLTDVVGQILDLTPERVTVRGRRGDVVIARGDVVAVRVVPPPPSRPARPHLALDPARLQELMVAGHPPIEREWLGRWLMRAAGGFTGRANSLLPLDDPGLSLDPAMDRVEAFYARRGLASQVTVFDDGAGAVPGPLVNVLERRGYRGVQETRVLTLDLARRPRPTSRSDPGYVVRRDGELTPEYLAVAGRVAAAGEPGRRVVSGNPNAVFLTMLDDAAAPVAVLRLAMHDGWAGLFDLRVVPGHRGKGLARRLVGEALDIAGHHRLVACYLQVEADNDVANGLYASLGFVEHHRYRYFRRGADG